MRVDGEMENTLKCFLAPIWSSDSQGIGTTTHEDMSINRTRNSKHKSSHFNLRSFLVRWLLVLLGIAGAWLVPFSEAVVIRAYISLVVLGIGAFKEYEAAKRNKVVDDRIDDVVAKSEAIVVTAQNASTRADTALLGRKLSLEPV